LEVRYKNMGYRNAGRDLDKLAPYIGTDVVQVPRLSALYSTSVAGRRIAPHACLPVYFDQSSDSRQHEHAILLDFRDGGLVKVYYNSTGLAVFLGISHLSASAAIICVCVIIVVLPILGIEPLR
jgi:hypothetical protein